MPSQDTSGTPLESQWLSIGDNGLSLVLGPGVSLASGHEREGIQNLCLLIWKGSWLDSYDKFDSMNEALCLCSVPSESLWICCFNRVSQGNVGGL